MNLQKNKTTPCRRYDENRAVVFQNSVHIWTVFLQTLLSSHVTHQQHTQLRKEGGRKGRVGGN
jgi:hypothetical protein